MKKIVTILAFTFFAIYTGFADGSDTLRPRYGVAAHYGYNIHSAGFAKLEGVPSCCPIFESGVGGGLSFGLIYEYPLDNNWLIGTRLSYVSKAGLLKKEESTTVMVDLKEAAGVFEHRLDAGLSIFAIEPMAGYKLFDNGFIHFGASAGMFMGKNYEQIEEIVQPSNKGVFVDTKSRTRNATSGDIKDLNSFSLSVLAGFSYELPLNSDGTMKLAPEAFFTYGLTDAGKNHDWIIHSLRGGLAFKYSPFENIYVYKENIRIDTVERKSEQIAARTIVQGYPKTEKIKDKKDYTVTITENYFRTDTLLVPVEKAKPKEEPKPEVKPFDIRLAVNSVSESGEATPADKLKIQVQFSKDIYPLLPYVFFGEKAAKIPVRYVQVSSKADFDINLLDPSPLAYHRNILNIIGYRLTQNTAAKITLFGFVDPTNEIDNCTLAQNRAEAVKQYLTSIWNIKPERIIISVKQKGCYPEDQTRTQTDDGYAENRRVEIESTHGDILSPVNIRRYQRPMLVQPKSLQFAISEAEGKSIRNWTIEAKQGSYFAVNKSGSGKPAAQNHEFGYTDIEKLTRGTLTVKATAISTDGASAANEFSLQIEKDTSDIEIESITLTLFKVSQARLDDRIKREIYNFVGGLDSRAIIRIKGYSDFLGVETDNVALSDSRAQQVRDYIKNIAPNVKFEKVEGIGSKEYPPGVASYTTPEERFLCRTVEIEIRKVFEK